MRDVFTPVFVLSLALLAVVQAWPAAPPLFKPLALLAAAGFLALFRLEKWRAAYVAAAVVLALLLAASFQRRRQEFADGRQVRFPAGEHVTVSGRLLAYPEIGTGRSFLLLRARRFAWPGNSLERRLTVRVACNGDLRALNRGDQLEIDARFDPRQPNRNFFANPYENYLQAHHIQAVAYCKSALLVQRRAPARFPWRLIGAWRGRVRAAIERRYLADGVLKPAGVFLEATLLGDRGRLENREQEELIGSGVFHLLAISGGNIAMLALVALLLGRLLRLGRRWRYGATAALLMLYLAVSGFDVSATRAVLMALLVFAGRVWFMEMETANAVSFCGLLLLAVNPAQFLDPGFGLTFALTAAIVAGRSLFLPWLKRLPRWLAELVSANTSAALMALPLSLHYFQRYAFCGFFSGLLLAPLAMVVTVCGALLLLLAWLPAAAAALALAPAAIALDLFFAASRWIHLHVSWSVFRPSPPLWLLAAVGLLFFAASRRRRHPGLRLAAGALLAAALLVMSLPPRRYRPQRLEVYFLDVGHGDAIVAVLPQGDALLVDGGGSSISEFEVGRRLVLPFLLQKRIRVRWAAVSHFHPDHAEGLAEILPVLRPQELWLASSATGDRCWQNLLAARPAATRLVRVARGFSRREAGVEIRCLAPPAFIESQTAANAHSLVLRLDDGRSSFLLAGDIEKEGEAELAAACGGRLAAGVLKVPHHGSRTSSSATFLDAVRPTVAVISAPAYSSYGFPHGEVVGRLRERGVRWLNTARSGGIMIASGREAMQIQVSK